jgi:hypothetical protein
MTAQLRQLINGTYDFVSFSGDLWSQAGSTVTVTAPGADVPAFTQQFPAPANLSIPSSSSLALATATRGNDIAITWQGGGSCQATFDFYVRQGLTTYSASCSFPSTDGSGTIPAAGLEPIPAGLKATYTFSCTVINELVVGDWEIKVRALADARTSDDKRATATLSSW